MCQHVLTPAMRNASPASELTKRQESHRHFIWHNLMHTRAKDCADRGQLERSKLKAARRFTGSCMMQRSASRMRSYKRVKERSHSASVEERIAHALVPAAVHLPLRFGGAVAFIVRLYI